MTPRRWAALAALLVLPACLLTPASAQKQKQKPKQTEVWTDPADKTLPADFKFQGEYATDDASLAKFGCQVIALGGGKFHAVVYPGGLPGAGWNGKSKSLMDGSLSGDKVTFEPAKQTADAKKPRAYLAKEPGRFIATSKFPPAGHQEYTGSITGDSLSLEGADGKALRLTRVVRKSPTMGARPPEGAIVLFDGTSTDAWKGGRLDKATKLLNTDGRDIRTKQKFNSYTVHLEFLLPYRPDARGQGRGNGGFYMVDMYEVQLLDSFGLEGKDNECSGVYTRLAPKVNMCLPPLVWQTYDIDFTNAVRDPATGKKTKNARITVKFNGVVVHDDKEIVGKTGGARDEDEGTPGPLQLQGHGNPLQFRNVWVLEKK